MHILSGFSIEVTSLIEVNGLERYFIHVIKIRFKNQEESAWRVTTDFLFDRQEFEELLYPKIEYFTIFQ